jgi:putative addiction module killer protein
MFEVRRYRTAAGDEPVTEWLLALNDTQARARINARIARLAAGNFGDCKPLRGGVWELRVDWGPGYRVYYARIGRSVVLLLHAGDKRRQNPDIGRAIEYFDDFKRRTL